MKSNRIRFFLGGVCVIIVLYGVFFTYFCMGKPCVPNNLEIEQKEKTEDGNAAKKKGSENGTRIKGSKVDAVHNPALDKDEELKQKTSTIKTISPEVYLCEITDFYEMVIIILFSAIFVILTVSFVYLQLTSKIQAQDMACAALESESFKITLKERIREKFAENLKESDIASIFEEFQGIGERVDFLEHQINIQDYGEIQVNQPPYEKFVHPINKQTDTTGNAQNNNLPKYSPQQENWVRSYFMKD